MIKFEDMVKIQQVNFSYFLTLIFNQNPHNYYTRSNDIYITYYERSQSVIKLRAAHHHRAIIGLIT